MYILMTDIGTWIKWVLELRLQDFFIQFLYGNPGNDKLTSLVIQGYRMDLEYF